MFSCEFRHSLLCSMQTNLPPNPLRFETLPGQPQTKTRGGEWRDGGLLLNIGVLYCCACILVASVGEEVDDAASLRNSEERLGRLASLGFLLSLARPSSVS